MIISEKPWECPRCKSWHGPNSEKCDCKPIKRQYCAECLADAYSVFDLPFPSYDVIQAWAEHFHLNYAHREVKDENK